MMDQAVQDFGTDTADSALPEGSLVPLSRQLRAGGIDRR
jgi:hypothetical protein